MAGLMFFGKTPRFKYEWFMIKTVWFYGNSIGENEFRDSRDFVGTIPFMFAFVKKKSAGERILDCLRRDEKMSIAALAATLEMSTSGIAKNLKILKEKGLLERIGPDKGGRWKVKEE